MTVVFTGFLFLCVGELFLPFSDYYISFPFFACLLALRWVWEDGFSCRLQMDGWKFVCVKMKRIAWLCESIFVHADLVICE